MSELRLHTIQVGVWYVEQFEKDNEFFIECLVNFRTVRDIFLMVYHALIADKKISPIELWPIDLKEAIWNDAKDLSKQRLDKYQLIQF